MKVLIVGLGYVGLTHAAYLSSFHDVIGYDIDRYKIEALHATIDYLFEPQLLAVIKKNKAKLQWMHTLPETLSDVAVVLLAVHTPEAHDGRCDVSSLEDTLDVIAPRLNKGVMVIVRSTTPPGTLASLRIRLAKQSRDDLSLVSMPEFMVLGQTYQDVSKPTRVIVGTHDASHDAFIRQLFQYPAKIPFVVMTPESAELTKYASNTYLATKLSFINQMADLADKVHANIDDVTHGMGLDPRIGSSYLQPGVGYGGSCFPKDLQALQHVARDVGVEPTMLLATERANDDHMVLFAKKIIAYFDQGIEGLNIAVCGLSFKGSSHEVRHSPAFVIVDTLVDHKANITVYDRKATFEFFEHRGEKPCLAYTSDLKDALKNADVCVLLTDAPELKALKAIDFIQLMKTPIIFDGRNLYSLASMKGTTYISVGRPRIQ
jgi:UDPglucose 6-dehydrogenase